MNEFVTQSSEWTLERNGDLLKNHLSSRFSDILIYSVKHSLSLTRTGFTDWYSGLHGRKL